MSPRPTLRRTAAIVALAAVFGAAPAAADPVTITWGAFMSGDALADADGVPLPVGDTVWIGTFAIPAPEVRNYFLAGRMPDIAAAFSPLSSELIGNFGGEVVVENPSRSKPGNPQDTPGLFSQDVVVENATRLGQRLYLVAGDLDSPGAGIAILSAPHWTVPSNPLESLTVHPGAVADPGDTCPGDDGYGCPHDLYLALRGPQESDLVGGPVNRLVVPPPPGDPLGDPDGDGLTTLLEQAFGSDPFSPSHDAPVTGTPGTGPGGEALQTIYFPAHADGTGDFISGHHAAGFIYRLQISDDLDSWRAPAPGELEVTLDPAPDGMVAVSAVITPATNGGRRCYVRVAVEQAP